MNDENLERHLRGLPAPELPETWRVEILSKALSESRKPSHSRQVWPTLLLYLQNLFLRNPVTASALTALWLLIVLFKSSTPVDPSEKMLIAHFDPQRPVYLVTLSDEGLIAQLEQDQPVEKPLGPIP